MLQFYSYMQWPEFHNFMGAYSEKVRSFGFIINTCKLVNHTMQVKYYLKRYCPFKYTTPPLYIVANVAVDLQCWSL